MRQCPTSTNPFVMLIDPDTILQAVERSERLNLLNRQVYRPLDRPLIPKVDGQDAVESDDSLDF
jgi:hypothetical protein